MFNFIMPERDVLLQCSMAVERSAGWAEKHAAGNQRLIAQYASAQAECERLSGSLSSLSASLDGWISESAASTETSGIRDMAQGDSEAATADHDDIELTERRNSNAAASTSADAEGLQALNAQISELKTDMTSTAAEIKAEEGASAVVAEGHERCQGSHQGSRPAISACMLPQRSSQSSCQPNAYRHSIFRLLT